MQINRPLVIDTTKPMKFYKQGFVCFVAPIAGGKSK